MHWNSCLFDLPVDDDWNQVSLNIYRYRFSLFFLFWECKQSLAVSTAVDVWQLVVIISDNEFNRKHLWSLSLICEVVSCVLFLLLLFIRSAEWLRDVACPSKWSVYCCRDTILVWTDQTSGPVRTESLTENCSACGQAVGTVWGFLDVYHCNSVIWPTF